MQGIKAVIRSRHKYEMEQYQKRKRNAKLFAVATGIITGTLMYLIMQHYN